ncbi:MAG: dehydrogenase [Planctomycetes bacterium]|nr:dehydrogenase [Planctomycetota bacterium]
MSDHFRVGLTRDFLSADGRLAFQDIGLGLLDAQPGVTTEFFREHRDEVTPDQIADFDAVIAYVPRWTARSFEGRDRLTLVARFGVGYDMVDLDACTRNDVIVSITPEGVMRPMAEGALTLMLALAKEIFAKSRVLREGRWMDHKFITGSCLAGKTVGSLGLGNIGSDLMRLLEPFGLARRIACDPYATSEHARGLGVELVDRDTLLRESDFVVITCMLTPQTRGLIDSRALGLMKPAACLVNVSRGPIVDQKALSEALRGRRIRGAALDVFEVEPLPPDDPLLDLDNVILLPHAIGWTHECLLGNGRGACQAALQVYRGIPPAHVVNREVLDRPGLRRKLERYRQLYGATSRAVLK